MKYRKKPVVVEAFRFQIDDAMPDWFLDKMVTKEIITQADGTCDIRTLEGVMKADKGDYIILGIKDEVYPCKPDIFEQTYEKENLTASIVMDGESIMKALQRDFRKMKCYAVE